MKELIIKFKQKFCKHKFKCNDILLTGIEPPPMPIKGAGYQAFMDWEKTKYTGDHYTKRVSCKCHKCNKVFFAHCGLDLNKYGKMEYLYIKPCL